MEDTESPRIFHIYTALSGIAAALGRKAYLPWGQDALYPNLYISLVGPPGVRKGSAISIMRKILRRSCNIRYAPDDTGGARQGLISAMVEKEDNEEIQKLLDNIEIAGEQSLEEIGNFDLSKLMDERDKNVMYVCASELNSVLGQDVGGLIPFLCKMYDCEPYDYRIKNQRQVLDNALLNILGATTPQSISSAFPPEAIGQGFMSRMIFVYGAQKYKSFPRPVQLPRELEREIGETYEYVGHEFEGEFEEAEDAKVLIDMVYEEKPNIVDPRFVYYCERRHTHLIKLCMCLAAARRSLVIQAVDVQDARALLTATETVMPEALGEYGMNKLSVAKQKLVEFLRNANEPVNANILYAMMSRDMSQVDFRNSVSDLCNAGKIMELKTGGGQAFIYKDPNNEEVDEILSMMTEDDEEESPKVTRLRPKMGED